MSLELKTLSTPARIGVAFAVAAFAMILVLGVLQLSRSIAPAAGLIPLRVLAGGFLAVSMLIGARHWSRRGDRRLVLACTAFGVAAGLYAIEGLLIGLRQPVPNLVSGLIAVGFAASSVMFCVAVFRNVRGNDSWGRPAAG